MASSSLAHQWHGRPSVLRMLTVRIVELKGSAHIGELLRRHRIAHHCVAFCRELFAVAVHHERAPGNLGLEAPPMHCCCTALR